MPSIARSQTIRNAIFVHRPSRIVSLALILSAALLAIQDFIWKILAAVYLAQQCAVGRVVEYLYRDVLIPPALLMMECAYVMVKALLSMSKLVISVQLVRLDLSRLVRVLLPVTENAHFAPRCLIAINLLAPIRLVCGVWNVQMVTTNPWPMIPYVHSVLTFVRLDFMSKSIAVAILIVSAVRVLFYKTVRCILVVR